MKVVLDNEVQGWCKTPYLSWKISRY